MAPTVALSSTPVTIAAGANTVDLTITSVTGDPTPSLFWEYSLNGGASVQTTATLVSGNTYKVSVPANDGSYTDLDITVSASNASGVDTDSANITVGV